MIYQPEDMIEASEKAVQEIVYKFNNLTQLEKTKVFSNILCVDSLAVEYTNNVFALCSLITFVYKKYKEKHPEISIETFSKGFLKDTCNPYPEEWMNNILPLFEVLTRGKKVDNCGAKNLQEFKEKIKIILDSLLPF